LCLLGTLKAGIGAPARYAASGSRVAELLAKGRTKTLLLNKGVALEATVCTSACSAPVRQGHEEERPSPRLEPRAVGHLHIIDPVVGPRRIELADVSTTAPGSRVQRMASGSVETLGDLRLLADLEESSPGRASVGPAGTRLQDDLSRAAIPLPVREPVPLPLPVPEEAVGPQTGVQPGLRLVRSPHSPLSARVCGLTRAETAVARLVAEGMTNKEIADLLVVSVHTVGTHVRSSFTKLNVTNRVALARKIIFYDCDQATSDLA
jgi:DNA-binding CsgD family transcriptional regulator